MTRTMGMSEEEVRPKRSFPIVGLAFDHAKIILSLIGVVLVWWAFAESGIVSKDLFPTPAAVF